MTCCEEDIKYIHGSLIYAMGIAYVLSFSIVSPLYDLILTMCVWLRKIWIRVKLGLHFLWLYNTGHKEKIESILFPEFGPINIRLFSLCVPTKITYKKCNPNLTLIQVFLNHTHIVKIKLYNGLTMEKDKMYAIPMAHSVLALPLIEIKVSGITRLSR